MRPRPRTVAIDADEEAAEGGRVLFGWCDAERDQFLAERPRARMPAIHQSERQLEGDGKGARGGDGGRKVACG